jgi:hypothetical protein
MCVGALYVTMVGTGGRRGAVINGGGPQREAGRVM